jgi:hypothetical protein
MYSSTLSLTSALDGVGGQRLERFNPGKVTRYPLYKRLGGPQGRSGRVRKISPPLGFDLQIVQRVASRYTNCAIPAHSQLHNKDKCKLKNALRFPPTLTIRPTASLK